MKDGLNDIEQNALRLLLSAQEAALAMAELFAEQDRGADRDNWKAVEGLIDQALARFPTSPNSERVITHG